MLRNIGSLYNKLTSKVMENLIIQLEHTKIIQKAGAQASFCLSATELTSHGLWLARYKNT
jgi:hypothetical protein